MSLIHAALAAVEPAAAVSRHLRREGPWLWAGARPYDLRRLRRIVVVGGGKAAAPMAQAVEHLLGDRITAGLVSTKYAHTAPTQRIALRQAGHPIPDDEGQCSTAQMLGLVRGLTEEDLVLCLLSGGASSLLISPAEGLTLADKQATTQMLLRCGATIGEVNTVRKHLSRVKGGGLARLAHPAPVVALILSDVVGNRLDTIGSGPTAPDPTTYADALAVLERYGLTGAVPGAVLRHLQQGAKGERPETPKPGDPTWERVHNLVIGSSEAAAAAAVRRAEERGVRSMLLSTWVEGEAREVGKVLASLALEIAHRGRPLPPPACLVAAGETTVTVRGQGKGGRNQELALAAAPKIAGLKAAAVASFATDGTDGPTEAAGAIADGTTIMRARRLGLDPAAYLAHNDSYTFFHQLGDLIVTGPTLTNTNDLMMVLVWEREEN